MTASALNPDAYADAGAGRQRRDLTLTIDAAEQQTPVLAKFLPGPVLLLGAPGVGKGTQAQLLMAAFNIPQISTGDLLRDHVERQTDLGNSAKQLMDQGQLVPDEIVNSMVADRLTREDTLPGFILDGFPRTVGQAAWLDAKLPQLHDAPPLIAIKLQVSKDELLRRITGRRTCPVCNRIYNIYSHPPGRAGLCDFDGTALQHRTDDTKEAFYRRMTEYESKTGPVIEHYRAQNCFREIDGLGPLDEVEHQIIHALQDLRSQSSPGLEGESSAHASSLQESH